METITYQVNDLKNAREWFDTLFYGKPRYGLPAPTDQVVYEDIPYQEPGMSSLTLILKDAPERDLDYWTISVAAYAAIVANENTEICEAPRPDPHGGTEVGVIEYAYRTGIHPLAPIRKRVGVIVNPNIGIVKTSSLAAQVDN